MIPRSRYGRLMEKVDRYRRVPKAEMKESRDLFRDWKPILLEILPGRYLPYRRTPFVRQDSSYHSFRLILRRDRFYRLTKYGCKISLEEDARKIGNNVRTFVSISSFITCIFHSGKNRRLYIHRARICSNFDRSRRRKDPRGAFI